MSHEEMPDSEKYGIAILDVPFGWSQKVLESQKLANLTIILLVLLAAIPLLGIGLMTTRPFAPVDAAQVPVEAAVEVGG